MTAQRILMFSRIHDFQQGALYAARMVKHVNKNGLDARLIVRGPHAKLAERVRRVLSAEAECEVEVRSHTSSDSELISDIRAADLVVMPIRAAGFGSLMLDATIAGIPILAPTSSGIGLFLSDPDLYPPDLIAPMLIDQSFSEPIPIDRWFTKLTAVLSDPDASRENAAQLERLLRQHNRTKAGADRSIAAIDQAVGELAAHRRGKGAHSNG